MKVQTRKTVTAQLREGGLTVGGEPYLVVGAEVHNSSSSTEAAIGRSFGRVRSMGANTVLAPIAWDLLEPQEGVFDFRLVDAMLTAAKAEGLHLVPLWFGSWKNGTSTYVPAWVKTDTVRFPRACVGETGVVEHLSPFSEEARLADAAAFGALMAHLRATDDSGTVIMVQVENEVGLLGDSRDRSPLADKAWSAPVAPAVVDVIASSPQIPVHEAWKENGCLRSGNWEGLFGTGAAAEEAFMAWAYSSYVEAVALKGRSEYALPMYANAWLDNPLALDGSDGPEVALAGGLKPGDYPSGGPIPRVAPIWNAAAPTLDLLAPDIYFGSFSDTCSAYSEASNGRLFIPEMRLSELGVAQMFLAVGEYRAIGVSPFGVDSAPEGTSATTSLEDGYRLLCAVADSFRKQPAGKSRGFLLSPDDLSKSFEFNEYTVRVDGRDAFGQGPSLNKPAFGLIIEEANGQFLAVGRGFTFSFSRKDGKPSSILSATELEYTGEWEVRHRLNGDETGAGTAVRFPALGDASPPSWPIPLVVTSTGMVRIELYTF